MKNKNTFPLWGPPGLAPPGAGSHVGPLPAGGRGSPCRVRRGVPSRVLESGSGPGGPTWGGACRPPVEPGRAEERPGEPSGRGPWRADLGRVPGGRTGGREKGGPGGLLIMGTASFLHKETTIDHILYLTRHFDVALVITQNHIARFCSPTS